MRQASKKPIRKMRAVRNSGGAAVIVAPLLVWVLKQYVNIDIPMEVAVGIIALVVWGIMFASGYYVSPDPGDGPVADVKKAG